VLLILLPAMCACRRKALAIYPIILLYASIGWFALVKSK
jgi:hypothetical protein